MPIVYFIGAGPGDPDLITVKGLRLIKTADLVLYAGSLVPEALVAAAKPEARVENSAPLNLSETHALMRDTIRAGGTVARVHTGDPSLYGAVREQMELLDEDGIEYEVVPGVTAAFAAAAGAKRSFTVPGGTQTLTITRMTGRTPVPDAEALRTLAARGTAMALYLSAADGPKVQAELEAGGLPADTPVVVGKKVGWPDQAVRECTLHKLAATAKAMDATRQTVFLILPGGDAVGARSKLYDETFGHGYRAADTEET